MDAKQETVPMTPRQRDLLALRYLEIETELQWLAEQDEIEYRLGG